MLDIENESLAAHVKICELRYQALEARVDQVDIRLTNIHQTIELIRSQLIDLKDATANQFTLLKDQQSTKWSGLQVAVIGALSGVIAFLVTQLSWWQ